jgi:hypothetical protein
MNFDYDLRFNRLLQNHVIEHPDPHETFSNLLILNIENGMHYLIHMSTRVSQSSRSYKIDFWKDVSSGHDTTVSSPILY